MSTRRCPTCDSPIFGHPNKRFCGSKCKDRYHNQADPSRLARVGIYPAERHEEHQWDDEAGWDGHKGGF